MLAPVRVLLLFPWRHLFSQAKSIVRYHLINPVSLLCGVTPTGVTCCLHFTLSSSPTRLVRACFTQLPWVFGCDTDVGIQRAMHEAVRVRFKGQGDAVGGCTSNLYWRVVEIQHIIGPQINTRKKHRPSYDNNCSLLSMMRIVDCKFERHFSEEPCLYQGLTDSSVRENTTHGAADHPGFSL